MERQALYSALLRIPWRGVNRPELVISVREYGDRAVPAGSQGRPGVCPISF